MSAMETLSEFLYMSVKKMSIEFDEAFGDINNVREFRQFVEKTPRPEIIETLIKNLYSIDETQTPDEFFKTLKIDFQYGGKPKTLKISEILSDIDTDDMTKHMIKFGVAIMMTCVRFIKTPGSFEAADALRESRLKKLSAGEITPSQFFNGNVGPKLEAPLSKLMTIFEDPDAMKQITDSVNIFQKKR